MLFCFLGKNERLLLRECIMPQDNCRSFLFCIFLDKLNHLILTGRFARKLFTVVHQLDQGFKPNLEWVGGRIQKGKYILWLRECYMKSLEKVWFRCLFDHMVSRI